MQDSSLVHVIACPDKDPQFYRLVQTFGEKATWHYLLCRLHLSRKTRCPSLLRKTTRNCLGGQVRAPAWMLPARMKATAARTSILSGPLQPNPQLHRRRIMFSTSRRQKCLQMQKDSSYGTRSRKYEQSSALNIFAKGILSKHAVCASSHLESVRWM